jgi:hypothetical protein
MAVMPRRAGRVSVLTGCHLYFARRVTFLPCADTGTCPVGYWMDGLNQRRGAITLP